MALIDINCPECGELFARTVKQVNAVVKRSGKWTCKKCSLTKRNKNNSSKIGSTRINSNGYVLEKTKSGWVQQHRVVIQLAIGRELYSHELVHHIDGNKTNNVIENLRIESWGDHTKHHHLGLKRSNETKRKISEKSCKYSIEQAKKVREIVASGISQSKASEIVGVTKMVASRIVRNLTYKE